MRFRSATPRVKPRSTARYRWRLWLLVIALGMVLAAMRQLEQPETARRLGEVLSNSPPPGDVEPAQFELVKSGITDSLNATRQPVVDEARVNESSSRETIDIAGELARIEDKTYFRPQEHGAWFGLLARLQQTDDEELAVQSVGETTYAQLLQQADAYCGQVVTIRGTVLRQEDIRAPENALGVQRYHRLWIKPRGGGSWPFVVYCLNLPPGFPTSNNLRASVTVTGYFFKNWSYPWDGGLGLAPVVLARHLEWQKEVASPVRSPIPTQHWVIGGGAASLVALAIAGLAIWRTRSIDTRVDPDQSVRLQLAKLAEREAGE